MIRQMPRCPSWVNSRRGNGLVPSPVGLVIFRNFISTYPYPSIGLFFSYGVCMVYGCGCIVVGGGYGYGCGVARKVWYYLMRYGRLGGRVP
ncbi:hypothetical protein EON63_16915, partial [archaeon]